MEVRILLKRVLIVWGILTILVMAFGRITVAQSNAGRTAADFLNIGIGARSAGMGGAYTAISEGAQAAYWNPSGLTSIEANEVMFGHFDWYQDLSLEYATFAKSISDKTSFAASFTYLNYGTMTAYDINGQELANDITASDWAGAVSFGIQATDNFSVGFSGKYINQSLEEISASAFAFDIGWKYQLERFTIAGFMGNYGSKMKYDAGEVKLPEVARLGIAFYPFNTSFVTSVEAEKSVEGNIHIRNGFEYVYNNQYSIRSGYAYYPDQNEANFSSFSFGAGYRHEIAEFDYAFTPSEKYTNESLHRFSLIFKFGK